MNTGRLKRAIRVSAWGTPITLPAGTRVQLVEGASGTEGDNWAVSDASLLMQLTGNKHDPKYRWLFIEGSEVAVNT